MESFFHNHQLNFELYDRLCAFNLYCSYGYETAVSIYPEQAGFILQNMEKSLDTVRRECYEAAWNAPGPASGS